MAKHRAGKVGGTLDKGRGMDTSTLQIVPINPVNQRQRKRACKAFAGESGAPQPKLGVGVETMIAGSVKKVGRRL